MDNKSFKKLLLRIAFSVIVIDGEIHQNEIEVMKDLEKKTSYFSDTDLSNELHLLIELFKNDGISLVSSILKSIRNLKLDLIQELLILEVTMRLIHADNRFDDTEMKFLKILRSKLNVSDELILKRFGKNLIIQSDEKYKNDDYAKDFQKMKNISNRQFDYLKEIDFDHKE